MHNKMNYAPGKDLVQTTHLPNQVRSFALSLIGSYELWTCNIHVRNQTPSEDPDKFFWSSTYFTEGHTGLIREAIGPIASREGSIPEFLRKPIATCDFTDHAKRTSKGCVKRIDIVAYQMYPLSVLFDIVITPEKVYQIIR